MAPSSPFRGSLVLAALLLVLLPGAGCGARVGADGDGGENAEAVEAAESWLALVDEGRYVESWEGAAKLFKNAVTEGRWKEAMISVRKPLGQLENREVKSSTFKTSLPGAPDGEYVVIQFATSFENKAEAVETITPMKDPDGEWRVSGYYIK